MSPASPKRRGSTPRPAGRAPLKTPWLRNSVRRRWVHIVFACILLFDAVLLLLDLDYHLYRPAELRWHLIVACGGLATLALLFQLARGIGASREVGLWAMALLGANVPWVLYLRDGAASALFPLLAVLAILGYTSLLNDARAAWLLLGVAALGVIALNAPIGVGLLLGVAVHAAWWVRQRALALALAKAAAVPAAGIAVFLLIPRPAAAPAALPVGGSGDVGEHLLVLLTWLLPLLAFPLLAMGLIHDDAGRWRAHRGASLLALAVAGAVVMDGFCATQSCLADLLGIAPLAALWLALGLDRLRARTPAWAWAPVGVLLVATTLPQFLVNRAARAAGLFANRTRITQILDEPAPEMLVPLYAYLRRDEATDDLAP